MAESNTRGTGAAPLALRAVRVILYVQGGATLLALVGIALEISSRLDHGQEVLAINYVLGLVSVVCGVLALVCAAQIVQQRRFWVRPTAMALEAITILYGIVNVVQGAFAGLGEIVVGIAVIVLLNRAEVREWINGRGWMGDA